MGEASDSRRLLPALAKSYALLLLALRHIEQYEGKARILFVRMSHAGTADFESLCRELFGLVYGHSARYNAQEGLWRFPSGATILCTSAAWFGIWAPAGTPAAAVPPDFSRMFATVGEVFTNDLIDKDIVANISDGKF